MSATAGDEALISDVALQERAPAQERPWYWVPSLYFAQALPNEMVVSVAMLVYASLSVPNDQAAFYTSLFGIPWIIKPLWGPVIEVLGNSRRWIWSMELVGGLAFAGLAAAFQTEHFFTYSAIAYLVLAFASATHDIAADGFYMQVLSPHTQTWFTGIRGTAFRAGVLFASGFLVMMAGELGAPLEDSGFAWSKQAAWCGAHSIAAAAFFGLGIYHYFALPPLVEAKSAKMSARGIFDQTVRVFAKYFATIPIATAIPFLLLYRFAEAQLVKMAGPFLLAAREVGGLGLNEKQVGTIVGTFGLIALISGGVVGGFVAARWGLKRALWWMAAMMTFPHAIYLFLAWLQPTSTLAVGAGIAVEKFGYGFGFTGYMLYMLYISRGEHKTAFYAMCTGFMALSFHLPASFAGWLQVRLGYFGFFTWIIVASLLTFVAVAFVYPQIDPKFGRKEEAR